MTSRTGKFMETENRIEITRSWVRLEKGKLLFNVQSFYLGKEKLLEMGIGDGCTTF